MLESGEAREGFLSELLVQMESQARSKLEDNQPAQGGVDQEGGRGQGRLDWRGYKNGCVLNKGRGKDVKELNEEELSGQHEFGGRNAKKIEAPASSIQPFGQPEKAGYA